MTAIKLLWLVAVVTSQGQADIRTPEPREFSSVTACEAYGREMTPRMQDWVRGLMRVGWDHPVKVSFECPENYRP